MEQAKHSAADSGHQHPHKTEQDDTREIALLDAEDWAREGKVIAPQVTLPMTLRWTVRDAFKDTGEGGIRSTGGDVRVPFETLDLDPVMEVSAQPVGEVAPAGTVVEVRDAQGGQVRPVEVTLRSASFAALNVETICLLGSDGGCQQDNVAVGGEFFVCGGSVAGTQSCRAPEGRAGLQFGDTVVFTVRR